MIWRWVLFLNQIFELAIETFTNVIGGIFQAKVEQPVVPNSVTTRDQTILAKTIVNLPVCRKFIQRIVRTFMS